MPMSRYNRENPFMYLLETTQSEYEQKSTSAVKSMIVVCILAGITFIGCVLNSVFRHDFSICELIFIIGLCILEVLETIAAVSVAKKGITELNDTIYGDAYQNINLNNEKLLAEINFYNKCIGRVEYVINSAQMFNIIYAIIIAYYTIIIMSHFIGGV